MNIFPAIDLYGKKAVRLYKGDYENMTVYSDHPIEIARDFVSKGAKFIHIVDLEGAKDGTTPNIEIIKEIVRETSLFAEVGGGIRDMEAADKYISAGVGRIILGTAAVKNRDFLRAAVDKYGDKVAVGVDIRDGMVSVSGWTENSGIDAFDFCRELEAMGVKYVICTDISKDGAMKGTNRELYAALSERFSMNITASGGVSTLDDIIALRKLRLYGAIVGKAYYTGAIDIKDALEAAR